MKQIALLTFLCLLLPACNLGNSTELQPPTSVLVVPTAVSPQSDAPSPPTTIMTEIMAVATETNDVYQTEEAFEFQTANESLSAATETQVAWVQDGSILMLDTPEGGQRELAQAHEIVELLWFSNGRHLLYVDQQEPTGPDSPPWSQHTLWLLDTETAEQSQLGTLEENLHRISFSPDERFIRTLAGSDFGDACFMDRRLVFVELDQNYQLVALHDLHDFDSPLSDKPYWFFPSDVGKWVSDHEYEVNVTAFCMSAEMGTSEEDLALIGRYRLNVETGTAEPTS